MTVRARQYRVRADPPDWRDMPYEPTNLPLREIVDLRKWASVIEQQGHLGSCTGQAVVGAYELLLNRDYANQFTDLSRLFVYYNARLLEGVVSEDVGAYIRDAIRAVQRYGVCDERTWPYRINYFNVTPTDTSYQDAKKRNIKNYRRIVGLPGILDALNANRPVAFSLLVYREFDLLENSNDYILRTPSAGAQPLGGHAMCLVGYDLKRELVLARNSFGADWCMGGYCWITFDYVRQETMDNWVFDVELAV
jgi:C1A family cysteine protease